MAVVNGKLSPSLLAPIRFARSFKLRSSAARAFSALGYKYRQEFGRFPQINSAYRTLAAQWVLWRLYGAARAAVPGYSNHGWGLAVDIGALGGFGTDAYEWLMTKGHHFGWWQPPLFRVNGRKPEAWHWEYRASKDKSRQVEALQRLLRKTGPKANRDYTGPVDRLWGDGVERGLWQLVRRIRAGRDRKSVV